MPQPTCHILHGLIQRCVYATAQGTSASCDSISSYALLPGLTPAFANHGGTRARVALASPQHDLGYALALVFSPVLTTALGAGIEGTIDAAATRLGEDNINSRYDLKGYHKPHRCQNNHYGCRQHNSLVWRNHPRRRQNSTAELHSEYYETVWTASHTDIGLIL